ncbi:MAG: glucoamylase family protein [Betaproteobacteria bacterium]
MVRNRLRSLLPGAASDTLALLDPARGELEQPIRAEIFGTARFQQHGRSLGDSHAQVDTRRSTTFFPRVRDNIAVLREAHRFIGLHERTGHHLSPAGEWLLDNFHIVGAQLKEIHDGLPQRYFRDLPVLVGVHLAGLPRLYGVAWAFVAHTDSAFNENLLVSYLDAYQETCELTLGELWALPTTLRVVLVENLRRLAERVAAATVARELANLWCDQLAVGPQADPRPIYRQLEARGIARVFALQVAQRLEHPTAVPFAPTDGHVRRWLTEVLPDRAASQSQQQAEQAADNLSVSNAITSLRLLGDADWRELIGRTSTLMRRMQESAAYRAERDDTQDATLHSIEQLARRSSASETTVADELLNLMQSPEVRAEAGSPLHSPRYWLSGPGRPALRLALGLRAPLLPAWSPMRPRLAVPAYLLVLALASFALTAWFVAHHRIDPNAGLLELLVIGLLAALPASEAVIAVVNRLISESAHPRRLPRLALSDGIPPEHRVLVVIPTLLTSPASIAELADRLEQHYLANPERHAQFALLSDYTDAGAARMHTDAPLLAAATAALRELNRRHPPGADEPPRFLLLHRERRFSVSEQRWIGWERKRGKLEQLLAFLVDAAESPFVDLDELSRPAPATPRVVTLDSDTHLPPGSLRELVGVAAHPLNQPRLDPEGRRVLSGFGILQPRVVTPLPRAAEITPFHWLFAGRCGLDPYSAASSEVYQDLFGEGTFTGKGLLDVRAMHAVLGGRLPEGLVLSHDLLEGAIARCGGVSDIVVIEEAPMHPDVAASRVHRWTRGDWQLLPLLAHAGRHGIGIINRWKMVDNLRRSLVAPLSLLLLACGLAGWGLRPGAALALIGAAFGAGPLLGAVAGMAPSRDGIALRHFYRGALADLARAIGSTFWQLAQLLQHALMSLDAIARASYRMAVSRRGLLQWTTAAAAQSDAPTDLPAVARRHTREPLVGVALLLALIASGSPTPLLAGLLCLTWAASPLWTWWASRPRRLAGAAALAASDQEYLLDVARETWRLFEHGVGAEDNDLPPDNLQIFPRPMVAHRTSPTNIGLYLVTAACARQFGWIGTNDLLGRYERTLEALGRLARHRGHFLNWYDTSSLQPLAPAYVSTVDSGNLCGCLVTTAQACEALAGTPFAEDAGRAAVAASRRRLAQFGPDGDALPAHGAIATALSIDDPLASLRSNHAEFAALVASASAELPSWSSGLVGRATDAGATVKPAITELVRDHLTILQSIARDFAGDQAGASRRLLALSAAFRSIAEAAEFGFLFNRRRRLFHIGYRVQDAQLDSSLYDLLASESRLASLWAIAKGDVPVAHWAALGRPYFCDGSQAGLRSWSGSMFEYLMPTLLFDEPDGSALAGAATTAVRAQMAFGQERGVPWGISESAYAASDQTLAYQYSPQGVPLLALRRTPADELVIAPYATALATLVDPLAAVANLRRLEGLHARDCAGFIEALDYTPERHTGTGAGTRVATFMAHHQGMTILALADVLLDAAPRRWAMSETRLRAVASLLQERVPREISLLVEPPPALSVGDRRQRAPGLSRSIVPGTSVLQPTHLLSNGRYSVALRANGAGWSRFGPAFVTRWRDDALRDCYGSFFYLRRQPADQPVSLTQHPAPDSRAHYEAAFHSDRVCLEAHWPDLHAQCLVWVSPEDDIELRRIELSNRTDQPIDVELMSAFEVSLSDARADEAHPAFANLFVRAQWDAGNRALYLERKPRLATEQGLHAVHFVAVADRHVGTVRVQADRARWLGRQRDAAHPLARYDAAPPDGAAAETALDPVAALSLKLRVPAHGIARFTVATAAATTRASLEALVDRYRERSVVDRSSLMSATLAGIRLRELRISATNLATIQTLATTLVLLLSRPLASGHTAGFDRRTLWRFGISGDRPIILVNAATVQGVGLIRVLGQALQLWTWGGIECDLVVLNGEPASYLMPLDRELAAISERFAAETNASIPATRACALHLMRATDVSPEERATFESLARVHLNADGRPLAQHVQDLVEWHDAALDQRMEHAGAVLPAAPHAVPLLPPETSFGEDGSRFRFEVDAARKPTRPWVNILSNPTFGAQVSESGAGFTWAGNSRLHQLTPWSNDPVVDPTGELFLVQDMGTREVRNVAAGAGASASVYRIEHLQGATSIGHIRGDVDVQATWCIDDEHAIKQVHIQLTNRGSRPQRLRVVGLVEWIMGGGRVDRQSVRTDCGVREITLQTIDPPVLTATQRDGHGGFGGATSFLTLRRSIGEDVDSTEWTCDRREFFDARGRVSVPDHFGERTGAGLDPCAALSTVLALAPGASAECTFLLGHAGDAATALALARYASAVAPSVRLRKVREHWDDLLTGISVRTPDPLFDALVNRWLIYQTIACRMWARAGFYQAGGAFGFRDQLQDAMALAVTVPSLLRRQILLAASRQFPEGDVQHWWHEPTGAGVRTHFSDDLLWLPHATVHYLDCTVDDTVLDEVVPFLDGEPIPPGAEDAYFVPTVSTRSATVYEHCALAIDRSLAVGVHGLPLMGTGDWNDGMNRVGHEGRGESVWLAWFLCRLVADFAPIAERRDDRARANRWRESARGWRAALGRSAWDGEWFVRAFFDDGSALGSKRNDECRIDLIAQAWSVLSGAAPRRQQETAMDSVERLLVDPAAGLVRLLDPPLAQSIPSAGYIQAYPPGVRENGGQYSHAGVWALMAQAELGHADAAWRMFQMLSPAHRSRGPHGTAYELEPYVMAGDVYSQPPYVGRGGWSWYTGSAAWMHRAAIESIAGLEVNGDRVRLSPRLPSHWPGMVLTLKRERRLHEFVLCNGADGPEHAAALARGAQPLAVGAWLSLADTAVASLHVVAVLPAAIADAAEAARLRQAVH